MIDLVFQLRFSVFNPRHIRRNKGINHRHGDVRPPLREVGRRAYVKIYLQARQTSVTEPLR